MRFLIFKNADYDRVGVSMPRGQGETEWLGWASKIAPSPGAGQFGVTLSLRIVGVAVFLLPTIGLGIVSNKGSIQFEFVTYWALGRVSIRRQIHTGGGE